MKKHLKFQDEGDYGKYARSHNWEYTGHYYRGLLGITQTCKCGDILLHPCGTIDFRFGCSIIPVEITPKSSTPSSSGESQNGGVR